MARVAWTLFDSNLDQTLTMTINPNEFDPPNRQANIKEEISSAPNGGLIIFQGRDAARKGSMSGLVNTDQQFDELDTWASKWYPLVLTDDLFNTWTIIITSITWKRLRRATRPHRYDYTIDFMVVG